MKMSYAPNYVDVHPSISSIETAVRENGGILRSFGWSLIDLPGHDSPAQVGPWKIMFVDARGMGNHGSFIAVATDRVSFSLQLEATKKLLRQQVDEVETGQHLDGLVSGQSFEERGDFACWVVPLFYSPLFGWRNNFAFKDEKWAYFAHHHANFMRCGDGRFRLWVKPVRPTAVVLEPQGTGAPASTEQLAALVAKFAQ